MRPCAILAEEFLMATGSRYESGNKVLSPMDNIKFTMKRTVTRRQERGIVTVPFH